jgi:hypothetical protein
MNHSEMPDNKAERVFIFAVNDLAELLETGQIDTVLMLKTITQAVRRCPDGEKDDLLTALSVLQARKAENAFFMNHKGGL